MGRGDRPPPSGKVLRDVARSYRVVLAAEALDELDELIAYIRRDSPKNAASVYDAIAKRLFALRTGPELLGHRDPRAPLVPHGATARMTTVKKVALYYLSPVDRRGRPVVYVVGIRRGARMPLEHAEYTRRWLEELAQIERG